MPMFRSLISLDHSSSCRRCSGRRAALSRFKGRPCSVLRTRSLFLVAYSLTASTSSPQPLILWASFIQCYLRSQWAKNLGSLWCPRPAILDGQRKGRRVTIEHSSLTTYN